MVPAFIVLAALNEETAAILRCVKFKPLKNTTPFFRACYELDLDDHTNGSRQFGILAQLEQTGRVSAAVSTVLAINEWKPSLVLIAGTAGGFRNQGVTLGDVIVATEIVDYETQRLDDGPTIRWVNYSPEKWLLDLARQVRLPATSENELQIRFGPILSGDKVVASQTAITKLLGWRSDALGVEMEGSGVAFASTKRSVPFLMIRGIADFADDKKREDAQRWNQAACDGVARFVRALLLLWAAAANDAMQEKNKS